MNISRQYLNFYRLQPQHAILCLWWIVQLFVYYSAKAGRDFWGIDVSLFWRFAADPNRFSETSPIVASVLEQHPGIVIDLLQYLSRWGIEQQDAYTATNLFMVSVASGAVIASFYIALRALGSCRDRAVLGAILATSIPLVVSFSRMHPLATVMFQGGFSVFAIAFSLFALALFVRGQVLAAGLLAASITLIHPITGSLAYWTVVGGMAIELLRRDARTRSAVSKFSMVLVLGCAISLPIWLKAAGSVASSFPISSEEFFFYASSRSTNHQPMRDGFDHVFTHYTFLVSGLLLAFLHCEKSQALRRILVVLAAWLTCYSFQLFTTEILKSPTLTALILNRVSPWLFWSFGALFASLLVHKLKGAALVVLLVVVLSWLAGEDTRVFSSRHTYNLAFAAVLVTFLLWSVSDAGSSYLRRTFAAVAAILLLSTVVARMVVGLPPLLHLQSFGVVTLVYLASVALGLTDRLVGWSRSILFKTAWPLKQILGPSPRQISYAILILFLALNYESYENLRDPNYQLVRFYSRLDAVELVKNQTEKDVTIFAPVRIDLNGVRKQYLDWKVEWYSLYRPANVPRIMQRLEALGIGDEVADHLERVCGNGRWIFLSRCAVNAMDVPQRVEDFDWRANWRNLQATDPDLRYVLIWRRDVEPNDAVVARNARFALIKP